VEGENLGGRFINYRSSKCLTPHPKLLGSGQSIKSSTPMKLHLPILWLLWAMLVLFLGSCRENPTVKTDLMSSYYSSQIHTLDHDGHKFVLMVGTNRGALLHHPDCPCGKR
jgi:hypothetical protein